MNYYKQFAEMLGLELGQEFSITSADGEQTSSLLYRIEDDGVYTAAMFDKIKNNCDSDICSSYGQTYADAILDWMAQPYKEPILDKVEREYLKAVIRPFRNKIDTISKFQTWDDSSQYIYIGMKDRRWSNLPCFPKGTMYKGMKEGKHYSLKELGL